MHRWENIVNMDPKETGYEHVDRIRAVGTQATFRSARYVHKASLWVSTAEIRKRSTALQNVSICGIRGKPNLRPTRTKLYSGSL
jgi:hypothetical protein